MTETLDVRVRYFDGSNQLHDFHADVYDQQTFVVRGVDHPWSIAGQLYRERSAPGVIRLRTAAGGYRRQCRSTNVQVGDTIQVRLGKGKNWVNVAEVVELLPTKQHHELKDR